jgi:Na+/phosphate symporter
MSTASKHILNEIADKLDNKKDDFQMQIEKLDALSDEEIQELAALVDWYESLENPEDITTAEKEQFSKKYDEYIKSQK